MIKQLAIKNFKSIKEQSISCKRINIFIGEPNVGKSNLLEAIGLFSSPHLFGGQEFRKLVRFENFANLFSDEDISGPVSVAAEEDNGRIHEFSINHQSNTYFGKYRIVASQKGLASLPSQNASQQDSLQFQASPGGISSWTPLTRQTPFRFYKFEVLSSFGNQEYNYLLPINGANLLFLLRTNGALYKIADELFHARGFRLVLRPHENKIEIQNNKDARLILFPYSTASDTLQRFIFHLAAVLTNEKSVISLEEPESHAFPYYTKQLAESIALDKKGNQFFISTHNPYFLLPIINKTPKEDLAIYITALSDYETKAHLLTDKKVQDLLELDADLFFNFGTLLAS